MKIVEYNHSYADKVADMWNKSGSSWGNDDSIKTGNDVINRQSSTGNLKLYLAIDNDEVVGYCSFSEYVHDEGASYLPLLNVRPDYHGKKVGKQLILTVLQDAIQSKWMRFDLFTWSGNIKAMPLYKKCGFFWEKNNKSVHLMNFLPYVYKTEALEEYMNQINWYQDSKRPIDMNQDGREENGFDYYQYLFQNEKTNLVLEFEKSGRGLRLIDTPDYTISMSVEKAKLVYEKEYQVTYNVTNKTKKPLSIRVVGEHNKNIKSSFDSSYDVEDQLHFSETFYVEKTTKKQDAMKTYPVVQSIVYTNGKKALFKIGVEPKPPISLHLDLPEYNHVLDRVYKGYLDMENNIEETTEFTIEIPNDMFVILQPLSITLQPKQRRSIEFEYRCTKMGFVKTDAIVSYLEKQTTIELMTIVKGHFDTFHAIMDEKAFIFSGNYNVFYDIDHARFTFLDDFAENPKTAFMTPQIGLPYNLELANIKPTIVFPTENKMVVTYASETFKGIKLSIHIENNHGIMTIFYELHNHGKDREIALSIPIMQRIDEAYVPYNG